jgi:hypothetical protein
VPWARSPRLRAVRLTIVNDHHATKGKTTMKKMIVGGLAAFAAALGIAAAGLAHADPAPPASCVTPDGQPCASAPAGCVNPDNSLPCSSSLPDVNAAIRRELQQVLPGLLGH